MPASSLHFGAMETAAHAATLQLGRIPIEAFAARTPDPSGWRGRLIKVRLHARNSKRIDDPRDAESWAREIGAAKAEGHDAICYANQYEGRKPSLSWAVWDLTKIEVIDPDMTKPREGAELELD
ncbi:hypothetical protein ACW9UR_24350 [Halovulum sp. GXIMD14794]